MRERVLDLVFLTGVLFKGVDGLVELIGGVVLLFVSPAQLRGAAHTVTAGELAEDPHDVLANLLLHGVAHLDTGGTAFLAVYLLVHGVVKLAIVVALLVGSRRIYPWAIAALGAFLVFQVYELVTAPTVGVAVLTAFDTAIIWLTWREWRRGRELRDTWRALLRGLAREKTIE
ncbi:DUF2127 domain-containing protein [Gryllotalpicola protaetiae]|uniref:DUF2127 domain-containing protein n=1 Tax=Gryllotalpicola protaetiae TaxID=2419771 RepID=A0A387BQY7_9MICO|nr:DUF2127 domain-containing protein [Gryllotalpicola protaetiae]AYG03397.1 DUF2127 domain-containing protein [Gryllotalpicola protaetiae]